MKSLTHYLERMRWMDIYDYISYLQAMFAKAKGRIFYVNVFGRFGRGSWLKKPDQIFGPSRIFIADNVRIERGAVLYAIKRYNDTLHEGRILIGQGTYINRNFNASSAVEIKIGANVTVGSNAFLCDFEHSYTDSNISRSSTALHTKGPIHIGDQCFIGANVFVCGGVSLGNGCVVGANSVVTRSFPEDTVIAGAPARAVRRKDPETGQWARISQ